MSGEKEKYRVVESKDMMRFQEELNFLASEGYGLAFFRNDPQIDEREVLRNHFTAIVKLKEDSKFDDISNLKDVLPEEVDKYLMEGWVVTDSYSKNLRMVKKKV